MKIIIGLIIKFIQSIIVKYDIDVGPYVIVYVVGAVLSMIQVWEKTHSVIVTVILSLFSWVTVIGNILIGY